MIARTRSADWHEVLSFCWVSENQKVFANMSEVKNIPKSHLQEEASTDNL